MASSTTKPDRQRERHQRQVVEAVAEQVHDREGADDRQRQRQARDDGGREVAQEEEDDQDHQAERQEERELDVVDRVADRLRAVEEDVESHRGGQLPLEGGQEPPDGVGDLDRVGARLPLDGQDDRALVAEPGRDLVVLDAVDDAPELLEPHRGAVAVGHDERPVGRRLRQLAGGLDGEGLVAAVQRARRQVDVRALDGRRDLVDADAAGGERHRVELDAHGVLLRSEDLDLGDAVHRRDPLRHHRLAVLVELRERQRGRGQREVEDRLVGRVDLLVGRRRRHPLRQLLAGNGDRRLHVLGGGVERARQAELQGDLGVALDVRRSSSSRARRSSRTAARAVSRRPRPSSRATRRARRP